MARSYKDEVDTSYMLTDPDLKKFADGFTALVKAEYKEIFGLGEVIAKRREELKLSQVQLAHLAEIPQADISRLEQGKLNPTYSTIKRVMSALQLRMVYSREESESDRGLGTV